MDAAITGICFLGGAIIGSFVSVVAHRLPRGEGWMTGRSRCPECGGEVTARDNVPVLSWFALRGRCRSCGKPISAHYPLTEIGLGVLYAVTYLVLGDDAGELALGLVLCTVLVAITLTDLDLRLIPNKLVLTGAAAAVAIAAISAPETLDTRAIAAAAAGGALFLIALAYPRGMGMGDVKLVAMMGLFLGRAIAPALLVGFGAGAVIGVAMMARQGGQARKQTIPFGPFLALGGVIALWCGDEIVEWYLDEFFRTEDA